MAKLVKLADIAKQVGVSTVTVSKALSGQKGVSEDMREKIQAIADELGYKQPSVARKLKMAENYTLGVIVAEKYMDKYDSFYWRMYQLVAQTAVDMGSFTMVEIVTIDAENNLELPKLTSAARMDGYIIIGRMNDEYIRYLKTNLNHPYIFMDFADDDRNMDAVLSDGYHGGYHMTNYLFELGHREIGYVGSVECTDSIADRYFGYVKSLAEHGAQVRNDWIVADRNSKTGAIDPVNEFKLPKIMPTAFFCNSDLSASFFIKKLREKGYKVPEDISVVGYDNYLYPGLCDIKITSYDVDMSAMGRKVIETLIHRIRGDEYVRGIHVVEGKLVEKESAISRKIK